MNVLAIDFDGVLSDYTGWRGHNAPFDPPVEGAFQTLRDYIDNGYDIVVHTSRADSQSQTQRLWAWFKEFGLERRYLDHLAITSTKPAAVMYIDDRAWYFTGTFPTIQEIKEFKTWKGM